MGELELKVHVLFDQVHGHMPRTFDHDLAVLLPGDLRQFSERSEFSQLCVVIRVRNRARTKAVAQAERNIVYTHDLADFFEVRIEEILLVMRKAPLRQDRSAPADNSRAALDRPRDITKQHARMDRKVIDPLLGLFDQCIPIHFPRQLLRPAAGFLESLINRNRPDRHWRIAQNPFAGFMNIAACREVHHRVGAPGDAPSHLLDFIFNRAGESAVTDVGIDLDQKIPADDHRLGFRMIDICRNNRAPSRNFMADELWSDAFRNGSAEGFARMLEADIRAVMARGGIILFASKVLANGDELHLRRDDASSRVRQLSHSRTTRGFTRQPPQSWKRFQVHAALTLRGVLEAQIAVIFRPHGTAFVFGRIAAVHNPFEAKRTQALAHVAKLVWIAPGPARVVDADASAVPRQHLAQRYSNGAMQLAWNVDAFAGRKRGIEIRGILELEFGSTHCVLPSSALSESGSRGRSLMDPLSSMLPR